VPFSSVDELKGSLCQRTFQVAIRQSGMEKKVSKQQ